MGTIGCPETSVRNCHYSLYTDLEERSSLLFHKKNYSAVYVLYRQTNRQAGRQTDRQTEQVGVVTFTICMSISHSSKTSEVYSKLMAVSIIIIIIIIIVQRIIIIVIDSRNPFPMPLCPLQTSHEMVWDRIQPSVLRGRRLTERLSHDTAVTMELKLNCVSFEYSVRTAQ